MKNRFSLLYNAGSRFLLPILTAVILILFCFSADESRTPLTLRGDALKREGGTLDGTCVYINADSGYTGTLVSTQNFMLRKGSYRIGVEYRTDTDQNTLQLLDNGRRESLTFLAPDTTYAEYPLSLAKDSQDLTLSVLYSGNGSLAIDSITLIPVTRFFNDAYFYALLILLGTVVFLFCSRRLTLSVSDRAIGFALLCTAFTASLPLFNGYLGWGDDICYHLIRIEGIKDGLADGQFPVVIYPEGMQGNGYLNCMYPNLFLYLPALLRLCGVSMAASYKTLAVLFHLLTAFLTYFSVKSVCGQKKAALLAAILYTLCPYRMTNFYARGALGEALAMTFFPLLIAGLYHVLLGDPERFSLLVLGISGLIQTHVLSALLGAIFCVLSGVLCVTKVFFEKRLSAILKAAALTFLLNLWFLVPFLSFYRNGGLNTDALDWCRFSEYSLNFSGLLGTLNPSDYRTLTLGLPIAFCAAVALFYFLVEKPTYETASPALSRFTGFLIVMGLLFTFLVINQFPGWEFMRIGLYEKFLKNIQFAWRMLGPASVTLVFAGCILLYQSRVLKPYRQGIFLLLTAVCLLSAVHYQPEDFAYASYDATSSRGLASKLNGIPKGSNTIVYPYEWCPEGFPSTAPYTEPFFGDSSAVSVANYTRQGTTTTLSYQNRGSNNTVTFPLTSYAGYTAQDENGAALAFLENKEQMLTIALADNDGKTHEIVVEYKGMAGFQIAFLLSLLTFFCWLLFSLRQHGFLKFHIRPKHQS